MGALGAVPLTLAQVTGEPKTLHCRLPHTAAAAAAGYRHELGQGSARRTRPDNPHRPPDLVRADRESRAASAQSAPGGSRTHTAALLSRSCCDSA
jgi:hypothetical protein